MRALDIDSLIGVPLLAEGEVTGVLVTGAARPRRFSTEDLNLLRLAAERVALAILHAQVYEREHRIAETLQRSLLPERLPQLPGPRRRGALPAGQDRGRGRRRLVRRDPDPERRRRAGDGRRGGQGARGRVDGRPSAQRAARVCARGPRPGARGRAAQPARLGRGRGEPDGDAALPRRRSRPPTRCAGSTPATRRRCSCATAATSRRATSRAGARCRSGVLPFPAFEEVVEPIYPGSTVVLYTDGLIERPGDHLDDGLGQLAEVVRTAPRRSRGALRPRARTAGAERRRARRRRAAGAPEHARWSIASGSSSRPSPRRWSRCAACCAAGCARPTAASASWRRSSRPAARRRRTRSSTRATGGGTPFEVAGHFEDGVVDIAVRDYGAWRPPREGDQGRGLALMRALMGDVDVQPSPEGTTVRLRRRLEVADNGDGQ